MNSLKIFNYEVVDSTNRVARDYVSDGGILPALFIAEEQTAGRGRLGRSFFSPKASGLYMTLALPSGNTFGGVALTVAVSVAAVRVLSPLTDKKLTVKWVNDILADGKKAAGILCEAVKGAVIIGIGINLSTEKFPEDIVSTASSLGIIEVDKKLLSEKIAEEILKIIKENNADIIEEYKKISAVLGEEIYYIKNGERFDARALDIDEKGSLIALNSDGTRTILNSGEITLRIKPE